MTKTTTKLLSKSFWEDCWQYCCCLSQTSALWYCDLYFFSPLLISPSGLLLPLMTFLRRFLTTPSSIVFLNAYSTRWMSTEESTSEGDNNKSKDSSEHTAADVSPRIPPLPFIVTVWTHQYILTRFLGAKRYCKEERAFQISTREGGRWVHSNVICRATYFLKYFGSGSWKYSSLPWK